MRVAVYDGTDHLGSTVIVLNDDMDGVNDVLSEQRYLSFGEVRTDVGTVITQTDFGFTGQRNRAYINLMDYRARFYSPALGRFTQPDSIIPDVANPRYLNHYSYTINNPVNRVDPSGHRECIPGLDGSCDDEGTSNTNNSQNNSSASSPQNSASGGPISEQGLSSQGLAAYQNWQGDTELCGVYAGIAATNILLGLNLDPDLVRNYLKKLPYPRKLEYVIGVEFAGATVKQIAELLNDIYEAYGIPASATVYPSGDLTLDQLKGIISDPDSIAVTTITYKKKNKPGLYFGTDDRDRLGEPKGLLGMGGHFMVPVIHDTNHSLRNGVIASWGFVNSWPDTRNLYWMTENDFSSSWGQHSQNGTIIISVTP
jgi:RHS repeat-associated protein